MSLTPTLLGLPYDASSSFLRGPAAAPPLIREQLWSEATNPWSESLVDISAPGALADAGDLDLPATGEARARIEAGVGAVYAAGGRVIALGGDHSVTFPVLRAVGEGRHHLLEVGGNGREIEAPRHHVVGAGEERHQIGA